MLFLILFLVINSQPLHETNGDCHSSYQDPNDCRHFCDHVFCDCIKDKKKSCLSEHAKCSNKCYDDGKVHF